MDVSSRDTAICAATISNVHASAMRWPPFSISVLIEKARRSGPVEVQGSSGVLNGRHPDRQAVAYAFAVGLPVEPRVHIAAGGVLDHDGLPSPRSDRRA